MNPKHNAKYDHIFVVIRHDRGMSSLSIEGQVTLTRAFWREEEARAQVDELNRQHRDGSSFYFVQLARLER